MPDFATLQPALLQGTLDVMVLAVLKHRHLHGYAIARQIERAAGGLLVIEEGSLYPCLKRLTKRGDLVAEARVSDENRRMNVYRMTPQGRRRLKDQVALWRTVAAAVSRVIDDRPLTPVFSADDPTE
ncbi:MAG: PadR family transcriptional regulator [Phycisphaerales bacterium]